MPVITVIAPPPLGTLLLGRIADAVADALGLDAGDVLVTHLPSGATVASGIPGESDPWPVVTLHGSDRGAERMDAARAAAEREVREWASETGLRLGGVWTEWVLPAP